MLATLVIPFRSITNRTIARASTGVVVVGTGFWFGWLGRPHNAFPSNARFHWVDYPIWDSDSFFYAAGRIPHRIFYDFPFLWQGINAAVISLLCYSIGRQLGASRWTSTAMATFPAIAGNVLIYANTAEDVLINFALLFGVIAATLKRRPTLLGFALALAVLGRPSFIVLSGCLVAGEMFQSIRHCRC
jgi:hypothetical protein